MLRPRIFIVLVINSLKLHIAIENTTSYINSYQILIQSGGSDMEENVVVTISNKHILDLEEIILDEDKEAAFKFLKENVYNPIKKPKDSSCGPDYK